MVDKSNLTEGNPSEGLTWNSSVYTLKHVIPEGTKSSISLNVI